MSDNSDKTVKTSSNNPEDEKPRLSVVNNDALIGSLFAEKYEILSLLGEGGMSKVYKARHKFMKRVVAVKLLHEDATKDPTAKARFQQEAEAASALSHQNVVTVHDFGFTPSGQAFFVMDCLEGKSLGEILEESTTLPLAQALDIFTQGCDGLDHAHRKGIVHRDIKPSNLVIIKQEDGSDLVKLVDFGIAKVLSPAGGEKQKQLTMAGEIFGTPAYMSPEQCSGSQLDARSDIYSFGCLMYETLAGDPPLLGETFVNTVAKHITEQPRSLAETAAHNKVPAHIDAVILKCLAKSPDERYASAQELKQALFDAAFASGVEGLRVGAVREARSPGMALSGINQTVSLAEEKVTRKWRLKYAIALVVIGFLVLSLSGWLFLYPGPSDDSGTVFNKISWQLKMSNVDSLMKSLNYDGAVKELQSARELAGKFGDGQARLEATLNKLVEVYGLDHKYAEQEAANKELQRLLTEKVFREYDRLMAMLQDWEKPSDSALKTEERAQQAAAFADRLAALADKLSIRSREKQEALLKKAIIVFDALNLNDWVSKVRFRTKLAECYRVQQRLEDMSGLLKETLKLCPEKPATEEGWRARAQVMLFFGQYLRNTAINDADLDKACSELRKVVELVKTNLKGDHEMLEDSLNSLAVAERMYHKPEHDRVAVELDKESKNISE